MRFTAKSLAENTLFALNIFIIFLIVAENKIAVPIWLQSVGRMHPMLLHFPIVLLLLAMLLEFFRFRKEYREVKIYQQFTTTLLLIGAFLSAITVVMGFFLSKEEGYTGDVLWWHKWTGIAVVFISSIIYWSRNKVWYKSIVAKIGAILTISSVIIAGHYGATLTHGENYVLAPIISAKKVPLEEAFIFDDVVMPIFSAKCMSCHNQDKAKGNLVMEDAKSLTKGGKSGKLFIAGKPESSLLMERIHLPLEDKKHMAPKNQPQLTSEEIAILNLWIRGNADFKKKVIDLPKNDSLRILATMLFEPTKSTEEKFDFEAADDKIIAKINNDYRVITPLFNNSPALKVNLYNSNIYNVKLLEQLDPIKNQIVYLNLNNLPVKDADLKIMQHFANLRTLYLNSTEITNDGVTHLLSLNNLKELSLYNTKLKQEDVQKLHEANPQLKITGIK